MYQIRGTNCSVKWFSNKSTEGLNTLKYSRRNEHDELGEPHKATKRCKEQNEAKERGEAYHVKIPTDAPILQSMKRMKQMKRMKRRHRGYKNYVASKGRPLSDFESLMELEKPFMAQVTRIELLVKTFCYQFRNAYLKKTLRKRS